MRRNRAPRLARMTRRRSRRASTYRCALTSSKRRRSADGDRRGVSATRSKASGTPPEARRFRRQRRALPGRAASPARPRRRRRRARAGRRAGRRQPGGRGASGPAARRGRPIATGPLRRPALGRHPAGRWRPIRRGRRLTVISGAKAIRAQGDPRRPKVPKRAAQMERAIGTPSVRKPMANAAEDVLASVTFPLRRRAALHRSARAPGRGDRAAASGSSAFGRSFEPVAVMPALPDGTTGGPSGAPAT